MPAMKTIKQQPMKIKKEAKQTAMKKATTVKTAIKKKPATKKAEKATQKGDPTIVKVKNGKKVSQ